MVACHFKPGTANGPDWLCEPTGFNLRPLIVGDVAAADVVMVFESQRDAFAVMGLMWKAQQAGIAYIVTRGAKQGKVVAGLIGSGKPVLAWKQNDEPKKDGKIPADEWLKDVISAAGTEVRSAVTPAPHKDANDWLRAGMTAADVYLAGNDAVLVSPPPPAHDALDQLLTKIHEFLRDFIVFPSPAHATIISLWIAHTWVVDAFTFTPYLAINSPVKRCGKSTLLDCLKLLTKGAWPVVTPSPAVLYRKIEQDCPTVLWDEVDTVFTASRGDDGREDLRAVLNSGFQRGTKVARCVGPTHSLVEFSVFCPKALAGIGKLPDTVADRSLPIVLARKSRTDSVLKFRHRDVSARAKELNDALVTWAQTPDVIPALTAARPAMPDALGDRASDISEPLLALADMAGGDWPEAARGSVVFLTTGATAEDQNLPIRLLTACREIFTELDTDRVSSAELLKALIDREDDAPWATWWESEVAKGNTKGPAGKLAWMLKPFDIYPKVFKEDGATFRGYMVGYFDAAFARYLPTLEK